MTTRPADPESTTGGGLAWRERLFTTLQKRGAIAVLILVVAIAALAFDNFLTAQNLQNIVLQGAFLGLIVVGMTFVIISGGIDLSVGSILALGGVIAALTVILPPLLCGLIGFGNGLLIAKAKMAPFIVTLAGLLGIRGLALALAGERPIGIDAGSPFAWFGQGQVLGVGTGCHLGGRRRGYAADRWRRLDERVAGGGAAPQHTPEPDQPTRNAGF